MRKYWKGPVSDWELYRSDMRSLNVMHIMDVECVYFALERQYLTMSESQKKEVASFCSIVANVHPTLLTLAQTFCPKSSFYGSYIVRKGRTLFVCPVESDPFEALKKWYPL